VSDDDEDDQKKEASADDSDSTEEAGMETPREKRPKGIYDSHKMSVVRIQAITTGRNLLQPWTRGFGAGMSQSVGSGFIVEDGDDGPLIVTNAHVVANAPLIAIQVPSIGQKAYEARCVLLNHDMDLAFVKVKSADLKKLRANTKETPLHVAKLFDGKVKFGMQAVALGFPLGVKTMKLSTGVLSGHEDVNFIVYQHTSPISPGSSGGPLFLANTDKVLAVNFATASEQASQQNNYAIPSYRVKQMLHQYHKKEAGDDDDADVHIEEKSGEGDGEDEEGGGHGGPPGGMGGMPGMGGMGAMFGMPQFLKPYKGYSRKQCEKDRSMCEFKVPKMNAEVAVSNSALYEKYGCDKGVFLSHIRPDSYLKFADPPVEAKSFITKVNDVPIDKFGMGSLPEFFDDPVRLEDILFSAKDVTGESSVEVCSCGETKKHKVPLKWNSKMESPVPQMTEPAFASLDYEQFGEVTIAPLTMNLAGQLLALGRAEMAAVLVDSNPEPMLVITDVAAGKGGAAVDIAAGMVVSKLNGNPVATMEELRKNFNRVTSERGFCGKLPEEEMRGKRSKVPDDDKSDEDKDSLAALIGDLHEKKQHSSTAEMESMEEADDYSNTTANTWVLQTKDGAELVKNYRKTLKLQSMMAAEGIRPLTPAVKAAVHSIGGSEPATGDSPEMMDPLISGLLRGIFGDKKDATRAHAKQHHKQHHKLHEDFELAEEGSPEREIALQALLDAIPAVPIEERKVGRGGERWLPLDPAF
jgi:S1-C subfamily serine protease